MMSDIIISKRQEREIKEKVVCKKKSSILDVIDEESETISLYSSQPYHKAFPERLKGKDNEFQSDEDFDIFKRA
jgi:hypothetical protein